MKMKMLLKNENSGDHLMQFAIKEWKFRSLLLRFIFQNEVVQRKKVQLYLLKKDWTTILSRENPEIKFRAPKSIIIIRTSLMHFPFSHSNMAK